MLYVTVLVACALSPKAPTSLTKSVCPHVSVRLPLDRFFVKFYIDGVYYISRETRDFAKIGQKHSALFMRPKYSVVGDIYLPENQFCATLNICKFLTMAFSSTLRTEPKGLFDYNDGYENAPQYCYTYTAYLLKAHTGG